MKLTEEQVRKIVGRHARLHTLDITFRDPSPAMLAWVQLDASWDEWFEMISAAGATWECAARAADHQTQNDRKENIL